MSFFYRNMTVKPDKQFFFGRTMKTREIEMRRDQNGLYGFEGSEPIVFNTNLAAKNSEFVMLVIECVLLT